VAAAVINPDGANNSLLIESSTVEEVVFRRTIGFVQSGAERGGQRAGCEIALDTHEHVGCRRRAGLHCDGQRVGRETYIECRAFHDFYSDVIS